MQKNTQVYFKEILKKLDVCIVDIKTTVEERIWELEREHRKLRKFYKNVVKEPNN